MSSTKRKVGGVLRHPRRVSSFMTILKTLSVLLRTVVVDQLSARRLCGHIFLSALHTHFRFSSLWSSSVFCSRGFYCWVEDSLGGTPGCSMLFSLFSWGMIFLSISWCNDRHYLFFIPPTTCFACNDHATALNGKYGAILISFIVFIVNSASNIALL